MTDTSELLLEGGAQHSLLADIRKGGNQNQTKNHFQGLLCKLAASPQMLAFAGVPQCWSTQAEFLQQLFKYHS